MRWEIWKPAGGATWHVTFVDSKGGQRVRDSGFREHTSAYAWAATQAAAASNVSPHEAPYSVLDALERFAEYGLLDKPASTLSCYQQRAGHLVRLLGDLALSALQLDQVEHFIATRLEEGAARETIRKELCVLRQALKLAQQRGLFVGVVEKLFPRFEVRYVPRTAWLSPTQFEQLMSKLQPHRRRWILVATYSGARLSEVEGLDWSDLSFSPPELRLRGNKTKGSFRKLPLHERLQHELSPRRTSGPVVEPWANVRRDLKLACEKAGVPRITPNDLRRTFASWLLQASESNFVVSRLLGHSSTKMVDLVYGQISTETLRAAVEKLPKP